MRIKSAIQEAFYFKRTASAWIGLTFIFAAIIGCLGYNGFVEALGNSLSINDIAIGYDHAVFEDMQRHGVDWLGGALSSALIAFGVYFLLTSLLAAGMYHNLVRYIDTYQGLLDGIRKNGLKFLLLSLVYALIILILLGSGFYVISTLYPTALERFSSEVPYIRINLAIGAVVSLGVFYFHLVVIQIRWIWAQEHPVNKIVGKAMKRGYKALPRAFLLIFVLSIVLYILQKIIMYIGYTIPFLGWGILILFVLRMALVVGRTFMRILFVQQITFHPNLSEGVRPIETNVTGTKP